MNVAVYFLIGIAAVVLFFVLIAVFGSSGRGSTESERRTSGDPMRISEYIGYGFVLMLVGGGMIGGALAVKEDWGIGLMIVGIVAAATGQIFLLVGIVAKGVQVGNWWSD